MDSVLTCGLIIGYKTLYQNQHEEERWQLFESVSALINLETCRWKVEEIKHLFLPFIALEIFKLILKTVKRVDHLF